MNGLQDEISQLHVQLHTKAGEVRSLQEKLEGMENEMATMREVIDRQDRELEKSASQMQIASDANRNLDAAQVDAYSPCERECGRDCGWTSEDVQTAEKGRFGDIECVFKSKG